LGFIGQRIESGLKAADLHEGPNQDILLLIFLSGFLLWAELQ
jgi:hypothetical protein